MIRGQKSLDIPLCSGFCLRKIMLTSNHYRKAKVVMEMRRGYELIYPWGGNFNMLYPSISGVKCILIEPSVFDLFKSRH